MPWSQCIIWYCKSFHPSRSNGKLLWHHKHSTEMDIILSAKQKILSLHWWICTIITTNNFSVPQGSILGPTLFNCYVSILMEIIPETEEHSVCGCADDHALINSFHPENTENFSTQGSHIACIQDWIDKNQLKMNRSKTEFIVIGSKCQLQTYTLNSLKVDDTVIMAKSVKKFLATYLDEFLNMKSHIASRTKMHSICCTS